MPEPIDLLDTLMDSEEIALKLLNTLSENPVDPDEIPLVGMCIGVYNNIRHAIKLAQRFVESWEEIP